MAEAGETEPLARHSAEQTDPQALMDEAAAAEEAEAVATAADAAEQAEAAEVAQQIAAAADRADAAAAAAAAEAAASLAASQAAAHAASLPQYGAAPPMASGGATARQATMASLREDLRAPEPARASLQQPGLERTGSKVGLVTQKAWKGTVCVGGAMCIFVVWLFIWSVARSGDDYASRPATCVETAATPVAADTDACAAVTDLDAATACEAVMTADAADAADAAACTYTA